LPKFEIIAVLLSLAVPATMAHAQGDAARGKVVYEDRCGGCHALDANRVGPAHRGVYGRKAGVAPGYDYSPALSRSGVVWTGANLDRWLRDPRDMVPGTRMAFHLDDAQARADVIAFLRASSAAKR
jgi:cytochrome c